MLRGALGLVAGPGSPRRKGQPQQNGNGNGNGAKLAAVLDAADDADDGALASPRVGAVAAGAGAAGEEDFAATAAGE